MRDFPATETPDEERALIEFFERVFEHRRLEPEAPVVGYAMSRIPERTWGGRAWTLAQDLMSQAVVTDTGAMHQYIRSLVRMQVERNLKPDLGRLGNTLVSIIGHHAPRSHTSEVAWALWAAVAFNVRLGSEVGSQIEALEDDVVALLALEASARDLLDPPPDPSKWQAWLTAEDLYGAHWLFAYEATRRQLLTPASNPNYLANEPCFGWLLSNGVGFTKRLQRLSSRTLEDLRPPEGEYGQE
jgi:hypothetical protein